MPSNAFLKGMNTVHKIGIAVSGGRWGWQPAGMTAIKLYTRGRKSGLERESMLTCPVVENDVYVIVASRGGDDFHPAWFLNLRDNPVVFVETKGQPKHERRARIATDTEREELWPRITSKYRNYAGYQEKTERRIPVVFLERP
ncbi:MAG: nitroreductase/quinone reductase family protein [Acidimicrobiales bacterium]